MMAKKLSERTIVFTLSNARCTQYHENFSWSTEDVGLEPWASRRIRASRAECSSGVKNFTSDGVCGSMKRTTMPKTMVIAPSTKKMKG